MAVGLRTRLEKRDCNKVEHNRTKWNIAAVYKWWWGYVLIESHRRELAALELVRRGEGDDWHAIGERGAFDETQVHRCVKLVKFQEKRDVIVALHIVLQHRRAKVRKKCCDVRLPCTHAARMCLQPLL
jgi:hypothetical protein